MTCCTRLEASLWYSVGSQRTEELSIRLLAIQSQKLFRSLCSNNIALCLCLGFVLLSDAAWTVGPQSIFLVGTSPGILIWPPQPSSRFSSELWWWWFYQHDAGSWFPCNSHSQANPLFLYIGVMMALPQSSGNTSVFQILLHSRCKLSTPIFPVAFSSLALVLS